MNHPFRLFLIAIACYGLSIVFFAPRFYAWVAGGPSAPEVQRAYCELVRLQNPSCNVPGVGDTIRWRLLFPTVGHYLHLSPTSFMVLPFVFCLLLVLWAAHLAFESTRSYLWAGGAGLITATSSAVFVSTGFLAYFDSALLLTILVAAFSKKPLEIWMAACLAPWIDERFIFALPLIAWIQWCRTGRLFSCIPPLLLGIAPYLIFRLVAVIMGIDTVTGGYLEGLFKSPNDPHKILWGLWDSLRWGWVFVFAAVVLAPSWRSRIFALTVITLSMAFLIFSSGDYSRSMGVMLPMALWGMMKSAKVYPKKSIYVLFVVLLLNLFTPAYHSFRAFRAKIYPLSYQCEQYKLLMDFEKCLKAHGGHIVNTLDQAQKADAQTTKN